MKSIYLLLSAGLVAALCSEAQAQRTLFSVDWHSPTVGIPDTFTGNPITPGDILTPTAGLPMLGPLAVPGTMIPHPVGGLNLMAGCIGSPAGVPCHVEVDAFSLGLDDRIDPSGIAAGQLHFGVDIFAVGMPAGPIPDVFSESAVFDSGADGFLNTRALPGGPLGPGPSMGNTGFLDGDGLFSGSGYTYPGLGLIEPSMPLSPSLWSGDNLDALDNLPPGPITPIGNFFSLDGPFADPMFGVPHSGSAAFHGFVGGDVLVAAMGALAPVVYAPAGALGLDVLGVDTDDLDAIILTENFVPGYQASQVPYDWMLGTTDMLLFSVRRGSAVIGMPDSIFGIPIEEGDILTAPLPTVFGGVSPFPGIFVAAENFGLTTLRSGAMTIFADDLNALDSYVAAVLDCDSDGIEDAVAIANGIVTDANQNGIPDVCEPSLPCTPLNNSTGFPTVMTGTASMAAGSGLHLEGTSGPPTQFGFFLVGTGLQSPGQPVASGLLCLATSSPNMIGRYNIASTNMNSIGQFDAAGVLQNVVGTSTIGSGFDVPVPLPFGGTILPGSTWHFQLWHRDIPGTANFSNAVSWTF